MEKLAADDSADLADDLGKIAAVASLIDLASNQIAASLARAESLDTQALSLIGFAAAMVAVAVAAEGLLGGHSWIAIPGLAASTAFGVSVLAVTRFDLGPSPNQLYAEIERDSISNEQLVANLLADLVEADTSNQGPLRLKTARLLAAVAALMATIIYTTVLLLVL